MLITQSHKFEKHIFRIYSLCTLRVGDSGLCFCACVTHFERQLTPFVLILHVRSGCSVSDQ